MNMTPRPPYRLVKRGEAGLACDEEGLTLGAVDLARVRLDEGRVWRCDLRPTDEIARILRKAYGPQPEAVVLRLHRGLRRAAASIEAGDLGRAGIEAVRLGLPDLTPEAMTKLAEIADLEKRDRAWETEPRIPGGQAGGGQWTTDGGGAPTANIRPARHASAGGARRERLAPRKSPRIVGGAVPRGPTANGAGGFGPADRGLLIHVNTAATAVGGFGIAGDIALPKGVARLGRAGLLTFGAALLDSSVVRSAHDQISKAVVRFGLDSSRSADVIAASAYVWSRYALPLLTQAPFQGPALDAASRAVMRFALARPGAFVATRQDSKSFSLVIDAANAGLSDYAAESRARPPGVDPALQTKSYRARAAIISQLKTGQMQAHHLIPASVWGKNADITVLAQQAGWYQDNPSNLIALPANAKTREEFGYTLPVHNGDHDIYNVRTEQMILLGRGKFPRDLTPEQARSIYQEVASQNRNEILDGVYEDRMKVGS
jgi:hypothetical protein